MRIVLDPGHGNFPGPGYDPGVIGPPPLRRHEAAAALELALTCRMLLEQDGHDVYLSRNGQGISGKPDLAWRIRFAANLRADLFVSIHFNMIGGSGLVYRAPGEASERFAHMLARRAGLSRVWPSSDSRFGGLYIDAFPDARPAVLWEVDSIERAPLAGLLGRGARLRLAGALVQAVKDL